MNTKETHCTMESLTLIPCGSFKNSYESRSSRGGGRVRGGSLNRGRKQIDRQSLPWNGILLISPTITVHSFSPTTNTTTSASHGIPDARKIGIPQTEISGNASHEKMLPPPPPPPPRPQERASRDKIIINGQRPPLPLRYLWE